MFLAAEVGGNGRPHNDGAGPHLGFVGVTATACKPALDLVPPPAQYHPHCHPRVLFTDSISVSSPSILHLHLYELHLFYVSIISIYSISISTTLILLLAHIPVHAHWGQTN